MGERAGGWAARGVGHSPEIRGRPEGAPHPRGRELRSACVPFAADRILSTQRIPGRPDRILSTQRIPGRPGGGDPEENGDFL